MKEIEQGGWQHSGTRKNKQIECLKVSVIPEGNNWDPNGKNYCFHDKNSYEIWAQAANVVVWSAVEWGVTAAAASVTFGAGAAAKPVMGFVAGAGSELTVQWIDKKYTQIWPGHQ